jgi:sugar transferase (PEP-CTERM/EpsH1 system associated)
MKILYTTARFPFPPLRGDQLTPYNRIQHLARRHEITLLSFIERPEELQYVQRVKPYCAQIHAVRLPRWKSYAHMSAGMGKDIPLQVLYYCSREYQRKLQEILAAQKFDILHTVLSRAANHTIGVRGIVKVCEMIDALSLTMKRRADAAHWPTKSVWRIEEQRMRRFEQRICKSFDGVVVVSEVDREALNSPNVTVIPVGTDFSPKTISSRNGRKTVIFTGNFAYHSNEDAAIFLITEIWPELRKLKPDLRLRIVGKSPGSSILRAAERFSDVEVTGFVPDLREQLVDADVAIAPIRLSGGGMHLKALEAMACGTPIVVSDRVTSGIQGLPGDDYLMAGTVPEYVQSVRRILEDPMLAAKLSANGRRLVVEKYSWEGTTERLERLYEELLSRRSTSEKYAHRN